MSVISSAKFFKAAQVVAFMLLPAVILVVAFGRINDSIIVSGVVESRQHAVLNASLNETLVSKISAKPGEQLKQGDTIMEFEDLWGWRNELLKKKKRLELLKKLAASSETLRSKGAISEIQADREANEMQILAIDIKELEIKSARLTLRAPFDGCLTELAVKEHQMISVGDRLAVVSGIKEKLIRCNIPESRFDELNKGQHVAVKSNMYNYLKHDIYTGQVESYESYGKHNSGSVSFEALIAMKGEGAKLLKVGSTATCEVIVRDQPLYMLFLAKQ